MEKDIKESMRSFQRQRARDKADFDAAFKKQIDDILSHENTLKNHTTKFEVVAAVNGMIMENLNMQLEGEISDLFDRKMMALFGLTHDKMNKIDV